jgi:two-component sensor histidine kinase
VFEQRYLLPDDTAVWVRITLSAVADGQILAVVEDVTTRHRAEEQQSLLINELNHRVKNTLATVQSLAMQTLQGARDPIETRALFQSRLSALARAHDVLTAENWAGASLQSLVAQAIAPFASRVSVDGPNVRLRPGQALVLSLGLHELLTNAAKYGALSSESGRIHLGWKHHDEELCLEWRERGGPPVRPPTRTGFGTRLIEQSLSYELGGRARIFYEPEGVRAEICVAL